MENNYIAITGKRQAEVCSEKLDTTNLADNEAIIKCQCSLISAGTELSRYLALKQGFKYPVRPGYSAVGTIMEKGAGLTDFEVGQRVFYSGAHASVCRIAQQDAKQGYHIFPIPTGVSDQAATFANLGMVAVSGVNCCQVKLGDRAVVFGLGTIGLFTALLLQINGAKVLALDPLASRCQRASELGVENVSFETDQLSAVNQFTDGRGADIVVDATGLSPVIVSAAAACGRYSQLVLLGSPRVPYTGDLTGLLSNVHMKNIQVIGAFNNTEPVKQKEGSRLSGERDCAVFYEYLKQGKINVQKLITQIISPEMINEAYTGLADDPAHYQSVVIDWANKE